MPEMPRRLGTSSPLGLGKALGIGPAFVDCCSSSPECPAEPLSGPRRASAPGITRSSPLGALGEPEVAYGATGRFTMHGSV